MTSSSSSNQEELQHYKIFPTRPEDTGGRDILRPPSVISNAGIALACDEPERESGASYGRLHPSTSLSSDEDLRAIEVKLQELLEPESREPSGVHTRVESQMSQAVYSGKFMVIGKRETSSAHKQDGGMSMYLQLFGRKENTKGIKF